MTYTEDYNVHEEQELFSELHMIDPPKKEQFSNCCGVYITKDIIIDGSKLGFKIGYCRCPKCQEMCEVVH